MTAFSLVLQVEDWPGVAAGGGVLEAHARCGTGGDLAWIEGSP
jgi:hypothetical protein